MNLLSTNQIKATLAKYHAKPSKGLGQNFLIHEPTLHAIIESAKLTKEDTVLEIGPGIGVLTQGLAQKAGQVIAIEKSHAMVEILKDTLGSQKNIQIVHADALTLDPSPYTSGHYKIVANLPYYITSPVIRKFLEAPQKPDVMVLMVQKEVAQRICAKPPKMSVLAVSVQFYADAKIVLPVSKERFWPKPKVDSAVIKITPHKKTPIISPELFFTVVKAGFLHPRKQLANNLAEGLKKDSQEVKTWLLANTIQPKQRAETLTVAQWERLTNSLIKT